MHTISPFENDGPPRTGPGHWWKKPPRRPEREAVVLRKRQELRKRVATAEQRQPPSCIIIGTQKGGTSSLQRYLCRHPEVTGSLRGEDHYFSWRYEHGLDWKEYLARFPLCGEVRAVVVSSPSYLFHSRTPERVRSALPGVKLIALLRNPVNRAYSQYQMNVRKGIEPLSFEAAIAAEPERLRGCEAWSDEEWHRGAHVAYLSRGLYAEQLRRWSALFPREQLLVRKSEEFFQWPDGGLHEILAFLNLPPRQLDTDRVHNSGTYEPMEPEMRERLHEYFAPHNRQLYDLVGEDFGWEAVS